MRPRIDNRFSAISSFLSRRLKTKVKLTFFPIIVSPIPVSLFRLIKGGTPRLIPSKHRSQSLIYSRKSEKRRISKMILLVIHSRTPASGRQTRKRGRRGINSVLTLFTQKCRATSNRRLRGNRWKGGTSSRDVTKKFN